MKNLYLIPTDKPSRLCKTDKLRLYPNGLIPKSQGLCKNQNIYITSDEEIKEGDYFLYDETEIRYKTNGTEYHGRDLCHISGNRRYPVNKSKKIILTTDQDLIKDSVQAIDDEFLEWFVKNSSCKEVEVNDWLDDNGNIAFGGDKQYQICNHLYNKQIIPKEEPKQESFEEAAEKYARKYALSTRHISHIGFEDGAKWQSERMYSEEDLRQAFDSAREFNSLDGVVDVHIVLPMGGDVSDLQPLHFTFEEWFKQFKKK